MEIQFFVLLFGLVIGSFLNVVINRMESESSLLGRSACMNCGRNLSWFELVPVFSFLIQKGKCRNCRQKISWQYPLVEMLTAVVFLFVFNLNLSEVARNESLFFSSGKIFYLWLVFSLLIAIVVYDIKQKIIPDLWSFLFAGLAFGGLFLGFGPEINKWNIFSGLILAAPFALLWFVSAGRWIGLGDAKLALGIGWFLGLVDGISAIFVAFWAGSFFGLMLIAFSLFFKNKNFTIKSEIPFAPFLILGMVLIFVFHWDVLSIKLAVSGL